MPKVRWTKPALHDFEEALNHIARDNPDAAQKVAQKIWDASRQLADNPALGRPGRVSGTRERFVPGTPYLIAYREVGAYVDLLRILHGRRKWPKRM